MKRTAMIGTAMIGTALGAAALASCGGIVRSRLYRPPAAPLSTAGLGPTVAPITVTTADGLALRGLLQPPVGDRPVLLFLHGNASSAAGVMTWLQPILARGYGFVSAEYRGYSGNPGKPTQTGIARDADAFYAHARQVAGTRPLYVIGHSLGGGVAFDLALRHRLDALVTIAAFASVRDAAPKIARPFIPDPYDNRAAIAKLDEPLFLIHGDRDAVVSLWHAKQLHEAAAKAHTVGAAVILAGQDHRPDAAVLAQVIDAITLSPAPAHLAPEKVPANARIVPF